MVSDGAHQKNHPFRVQHRSEPRAAGRFIGQPGVTEPQLTIMFWNASIDDGRGDRTRAGPRTGSKFKAASTLDKGGTGHSWSKTGPLTGKGVDRDSGDPLRDVQNASSIGGSFMARPSNMLANITTSIDHRQTRHGATEQRAGLGAPG
mgnify:CR=1 FL=1